MRPVLQRILYEALPEGIVHAEAGLEDFVEEEGRVLARFQDGQELRGDLLVGADGLYSRVRARLEGRDRLEKPDDSGTTVWRGAFAAEGVGLDPAYSWRELWGRGCRFGQNVVRTSWWCCVVGWPCRRPGWACNRVDMGFDHLSPWGPPLVGVRSN